MRTPAPSFGIALILLVAACGPAQLQGQGAGEGGTWYAEVGFAGFPESLGGSCLRRRTATTTWFSLGVRYQRRAGPWLVSGWARVETPNGLFGGEECLYGSFSGARYDFSPGTSTALEVGIGRGVGDAFVMVGPGISLDTKLFRVFAAGNWPVAGRFSLGVRGRLIRIPFESALVIRDGGLPRQSSPAGWGVDWRPSFEFAASIRL